LLRPAVYTVSQEWSETEMRKCWLAVLITLGLGAIALTAADFWQSKKFTEWSDKEVQKILRDSPWARPGEVRLEGMGGGGTQVGSATRGRIRADDCRGC
jgi:hypothetical protein